MTPTPSARPTLSASALPSRPEARSRLVVFTKPAVPGKVKTRLVGEARFEHDGVSVRKELKPGDTARLHRAFLADVVGALRPAPDRDGDFELALAWAAGDDEPLPEWPELVGLPSSLQSGGDLGNRLFEALAAAAADAPGRAVAAIGSDHPEIQASTVARAFDWLRAGREDSCDVVLGPSADGGYFLVALGAQAVDRRLFEEIAWSTSEVAEQTLARCRELGLQTRLLPVGHDVDMADDLHALSRRLARSGSQGRCPHTRAVLAEWASAVSRIGGGEGE